MPRDRDGDEYEYTERRGGSSSTKTVFIVLGIVGGLILLGIIGCVGIIGYSAFQATKGFGDVFGSTSSSSSFFEHLSGGRIDAAYNGTSADYKAQISRAQFDDLLKKYPLLTKNASHTMSKMNMVTTTGTKKSTTLEFTILEDGHPDAMVDDDDDPDLKPKPKAPKKPDAAVQPKSLVVTLTMIEENGQWVVDKMTIP